MKFSVLMAVHRSDDAAFLWQALDSLARQSMPAAEVVTVCDGPLTDELEAVLTTTSASLPQKMVYLPTSRGLGAALRIGLNVCSHDIVARMDADDVCETDRFQVQIPFMVSNELDVVGSWALEIDSMGKPLGVRKSPVDSRAIYKHVWANPFIHPSVVYKKEAILRVGSYRRNLRTRQDYDLWFRCVYHSLSMRNIPEPLIRYRLSGSQKNRNLKVLISQTVNGYLNCRRYGLPIRIQLLVFAPIALMLLPAPFAERVRARRRERIA